MTAENTAATDFTTTLEKIIEGYKLLPEQIYNLDETGLNFKQLPQKTFSFGDVRSAPGVSLM